MVTHAVLTGQLTTVHPKCWFGQKQRWRGESLTFEVSNIRFEAGISVNRVPQQNSGKEIGFSGCLHTRLPVPWNLKAVQFSDVPTGRVQNTTHEYDPNVSVQCQLFSLPLVVMSSLCPIGS